MSFLAIKNLNSITVSFPYILRLFLAVEFWGKLPGRSLLFYYVLPFPHGVTHLGLHLLVGEEPSHLWSILLETALRFSNDGSNTTTSTSIFWSQCSANSFLRKNTPLITYTYTPVLYQLASTDVLRTCILGPRKIKLSAADPNQTNCKYWVSCSSDFTYSESAWAAGGSCLDLCWNCGFVCEVVTGY